MLVSMMFVFNHVLACLKVSHAPISGCFDEKMEIEQKKIFAKMII